MTKIQKNLLQINNLKVHFYTDYGVLKALDGVNIWINQNETLGIVGESGCGKTMTARAIMRLIPHPGRIAGGEIIFKGTNLLKLSESEMQKKRGNEISMVFQEPKTSLNPVFKIGGQITEILGKHKPEMTKTEKKDRAVELLNLVGIPSPGQRFFDYPHQLSGGMCQRVVIAMALACGNSELLIADEPTTALDVTTQAQILELFKHLQEKLTMSIMLISHDLGVISEVADRVAVMYAGSIVELTNAAQIFNNPLHPYTNGLLNSLPKLNKKGKIEKLFTIPGTVPNSFELRPGCKFFNRCSFASEDICLGKEPILFQHEPGHWVRCVNLEKVKNRIGKQ